MAPLDFFREVFSPAMAQIGGRFGRLEIFMPELVTSAEVAKEVSEQVIQPLVSEGDGGSLKRGKVLIASVKGDMHDIGKNMVVLMLSVNGFDVIDMGVDVGPREIIDRARETNADIVGLSSLMTTSMPYMKEVVELVEGFGLKDDFAVIVGGAPITPEYSEQIGADAFGRDAIEAVDKCVALVETR
jgi:5-methyltetrahydrofolate--homocysteine methyltransferase